MLKHAAFFVVGVLATIIAQVVWALVLSHHAMNATAAKTGAISAVVTVRVAENPEKLLPVKDASRLLDRISGLTDAEKKKIREVLASGLLTELRLESEVDGNSHWIEMHPNSPELVTQGSTSFHFDPIEVHVEKPEEAAK